MSSLKKEDTVRVIKTQNLVQRKLVRIARRYGIVPIDVYELLNGYSIDVPCEAADQLEALGYVKRVKTKPRPLQKRENCFTPVEQPEPIVTSEDTDIEEIETNDEDIIVEPEDEEKEEF